MAIPTNKHPEIDKLADALLPIHNVVGRRVCIGRDQCSWCGKEATHFTDKLSEKEYTISGFCQTCQDEVFDDTN